MSRRVMGRTRLMLRVYTETTTSAAVRRRSSFAVSNRLLAVEVVEALLEPASVRPLGARQRLEPLGDLLEAFLARRLGEPGVHLRVLVGLAGDRRLEVLHAVADRLARRRVTHPLEVVEVTVGVAGLTLRSFAEEASEIGVSFDVRDLREIEVTTVGL